MGLIDFNCSCKIFFEVYFKHSCFWQGILKGGKYHCTIDLLFDWLGISCMKTDIFCFDLQNRLIQPSQTGGQRYRNTSPLQYSLFILFKDRQQHSGCTLAFGLQLMLNPCQKIQCIQCSSKASLLLLFLSLSLSFSFSLSLSLYIYIYIYILQSLWQSIILEIHDCLFRKLDHFSAVGKIMCINETVQLTKSLSKFRPKKFCGLAPGANVVKLFFFCNLCS